MAGLKPKLMRLAVRLVGPLLLVVVLWRLSDPQALAEAVKGATIAPLIGALAVNIFAVHFKIVRWTSLLKSAGFTYPLGRAYRAMLASLYLGMVTPGRVGDVLRVQYVRHEMNTPYSVGLATTVMDRICDLYVLAAFVAFGIANFATVLSDRLWWISWAAVALALLMPLAFFLPGLSTKLFGRLYTRLSGRDPSGLDAFVSALRAQIGPGLRRGVPLTIAAFGVNYLQGWLIAQALGLPLAIVDVIALMAITSLLGLMPISISGIGVREAFLALTFPALGLAPEQGVVFGLLIFAVGYLVYIPIGFVAWQLAPPPLPTSDELTP